MSVAPEQQFATDHPSNVATSVLPTDLQFISSGGETKVARLRSLSPTKLQRMIRLAAIGDSTASVGGVPNNYDIENCIVVFPGSGSTTVAIDCQQATVHSWPAYQYVANSSIGGQTSFGILQRDTQVPSAGRKSIMDGISMRPDVVQWHGVSINDLLSMDETTPIASVDAVIARHIKGIRKATQSGIPVIDPGIFGYDGNGSVPAAKLAAIRSFIVYIGEALKDEDAINDLYFYADMEGITHVAGTYIAGMTRDGTHLSPAGGYAAGQVENAIIKSLFVGSRINNPIIYDATYEFGNPSGNLPLNYSRGGTNSTINSNTSDVSYCEIVITTTDADNSFYLLGSEVAFASLLANHQYTMHFTYEVLDYDTLELISDSALFCRITLANVGNASTLIYEVTNAISNGHAEIDLHFSTPIDGNTLGDTSGFQCGFTDLPIGHYRVRFFPPIITERTLLDT